MPRESVAAFKVATGTRPSGCGGRQPGDILPAYQSRCKVNVFRGNLGTTRRVPPEMSSSLGQLRNLQFKLKILVLHCDDFSLVLGNVLLLAKRAIYLTRRQPIN